MCSGHHALGVLHRDAPLRVGHHDDERDKRQEDDKNQGYKEEILGVALKAPLEVGNHPHHHRGPAGNNAREQQNGNAVSDSLLVNAFSQPHHNAGSGCQRKNDHQCGEHSLKTVPVGNCVHVAEHEIVGDGLKQRQTHCGVPGDLIQLFPAVLPFLREPLQVRDGDRKELNNDA